MNKQEFCRRLNRAGERARQLAQGYVVETLPPVLLYTLPVFDDPKGRRAPSGMIKFYGGRFLAPEELSLVSPARAAELLWVDGRVPSWINLAVEALDASTTHVRVRASARLVVAEDSSLPRDWPHVIDPSDPIEPFRVRGPALPQGWESVERDGRFSLPTCDTPGCRSTLL